MSNDAITVEPSLRFVSSNHSADGRSSGERLVIDTTEYDLNRTTARLQVPNMDSEELLIKGFEKPYYFDDESSLQAAIDEVIKLTKPQTQVGEPFVLTEHIPAKTKIEETPFCMVMGEVGVVYKDKNDSVTIPIAKPIYRVYPNKKGEYLPFDTIESYIKDSWLEAFHNSLIPADMVQNKKVSSAASNDTSNLMLKLTLIVCFIFILFLSFYAVAKDSKKEAAKNTTPTSYNSPQLTGLIPASQADDRASEPNSSPYQQILEDQTQRILKAQGIDVEGNTSGDDLGCFTE